MIYPATSIIIPTYRDMGPNFKIEVLLWFKARSNKTFFVLYNLML
jgi:hypothetical protein